MTQPRDGGQPFHRASSTPAFPPPPNRNIVNLLVESSPSVLRIYLTPLRYTAGTKLSSFLPTLSFLGPQGFRYRPLLPLALARPSSPSPPLSSFTQEESQRPHSFCHLGSALRDLPLFIPHALRVCLLSFCPSKVRASSVYPVKQTPRPLSPPPPTLISGFPLYSQLPTYCLHDTQNAMLSRCTPPDCCPCVGTFTRYKADANKKLP